MEIWKPIPGFEDIYEVSSLGRVKSVDRFDPAGRRQIGQLRTVQMNKWHEYYAINLRKDRKTHSKKVHHLVAFAFLGMPPMPIYPGEGPYKGFCEVNHKNGDKRDNRPENLEYCTRKENIQHAHRIGLREGCSQGERNGRAKLNKAQVAEIRQLYATGQYTTIRLGQLFGVGKSTVGYIVNGNTWNH
jgi:hypothetical protein